MTTQTATFSGTLLLAAVMEPQEIGARIKSARTKRHWTQLEFAREANVSPSSVARWERGVLPPVRELIRVAGVLGVDPQQLVEAEPSEDDRVAVLRGEVAELHELLAEVLRLVQEQSRGERRRPA
jgi:transcriptional regulator with XRE-family HTH domain